jgi:hypothetical protein
MTSPYSEIFMNGYGEVCGSIVETCHGLLYFCLLCRLTWNRPNEIAVITFG